MGVPLHIGVIVICHTQEGPQARDCLWRLPFLHCQQLARARSSCAILKDVAAEFHGFHEELALVDVRHQLVLPQGTEDPPQVPKVLLDRLLAGCPRTAHHDVIKIRVRRVPHSPQRVLHYSLEHWRPVLEALGQHLPLQTPPRSRRPSQPPALRCEWHLVEGVLEVQD